jgi:putative membrane protein
MIRLILVVPFLLVLVAFTASNQDPLDMWLLTYSWKTSAGVLALSVACVAFILGAFCLWVVELRQRRRARRAEQHVRELEAQLAQVQAALAAPMRIEPTLDETPHLPHIEQENERSPNV